MLLSGLKPGTYRRGGGEHLRVWLAERLADASGAENLAGAPWLVYYARALGNDVGKGVDLHSAPPVTGMLTLGHRSSVEPEVDLSGHWIDGDLFHVGTVTIGDDATVGARTTLLPGAVVGKNADIAPGSGVVGKVKNGQYWKGSPAVKSGKARHPWPDHRPPRAPLWVAVYGVTSVLLGALPLVALGAGLAVICWAVRDAATLTAAILPALLWVPVATLVAVVLYAALTVIGVRVLSLGLREGYHPVRSRVGWQLWATERLMDAARNYLFPLYASLLTPGWLRLLGAKIGKGTEISTALLIPQVHRRRGRRIPGRRHHGGFLRTRRRLDPRGHGHHRQAGVPGQLRNHPAGPPGARRRAGGRAERDTAQGQARLVVAGQPADPVAPQADCGRCAAHVPPVAGAQGDARRRGDLPAAPADGDLRASASRSWARCRRPPTRGAGAARRWSAAWSC